MKAFITISTLLALASANQSSHPTRTGCSLSQPAADPSDVHNPYTADYKPIAAVHAPAHAPVHAPYHPTPYHPAPYHPAPYHPAPVVPRPAPLSTQHLLPTTQLLKSMKVFVFISTLLALASANQSSHQTIQHGHAAPVHTSIHRPHGVHHASVVSQPAADPSDVHNPYTADYKPIAAVHAPAHAPVHAPYHPAPYHPAPYHPAPVVHRPAPYHPAPYHPAPVVHRPAPYHPAPVFVVISTLLALASANQSSHQTIQHGHAAPVHTSIHRPHGVHHASVVSQPAADPSDVHNPYTADYKPIAAVHAPLMPSSCSLPIKLLIAQPPTTQPPSQTSSLPPSPCCSQTSSLPPSSCSLPPSSRCPQAFSLSRC
ncbi:unnamed protein product [Lepeophtheirus salmonis]|uniref:(salmon louse) hypothetical protein n=1 Tax=Lepeophtheirus salmonis TaxID=72036 RepID=A0A817F9K4_LEPSM|nr:unnamed protein product [Lepeophtheirus salmonis]CAG9475445.1 unnamed protein product [Lepeophtheirus salmonis]